ncbi:MAG: hypothetical protein GY754_40525 [bacterium]|nr:hypothetical protein [bacterium]
MKPKKLIPYGFIQKIILKLIQNLLNLLNIDKIEVILMYKTKKLLLSTIILLFTILCTSTLFAKAIYINWEPFPETVRYKIRVMNNDGVIILDRTTAATSLSANLKSGKYKIKIGMIKSANFDRLARQTKWLPFVMKSEKYQKPPQNARGSMKSGPKDTVTAKIFWQSPAGADQVTLMYEVFRRDGDEYVSVNKKGYVRIAQEEASISKIKKYLIYKWRVNDFHIIGETTKTAYIVYGLDPSGDHTFAVRSVNALGAKSEKIDVKFGLFSGGSGGGGGGMGIDVTLMGGLIIPVGGFTDYLGLGYGNTLYASMENIFLDNLEFGLGFGYWGFAGNGEYKSSRMLPILFKAGYNIPLPGFFRLVPEVEGGVSFVHYEKTSNQSNDFIRPTLKLGLALEMNFSGSAFARVGGSYGGLVDGSSLKSLIFTGVAIGMKF